MRPLCVILDRDGVINAGGGKVNRPEHFVLLPGVGAAIARLNEAGILVAVATNQGGVGMGFMTEEDLREVHEEMASQLHRQGAYLDHISYCCEHPRAKLPMYRSNSPRRKPRSGMLQEIVLRFGVPPTRCVMVGDKETDIAPGNRLGMTTYYVGMDPDEGQDADHLMFSLVEVVDHILG